MKVFSVCGITQTGKTTTIEHIICELKARGYKVGSVKEIHFEAFALDPGSTSNTYRHRQAGAELVTARGYYETDVLFPGKLDMRRILSFYHGFDYVVLEGVSDIPVPTIVTAIAPEDIELKLNDYVFCISGRIAAQITEYKNIPAISAVADAKALVDLIEQKVYEMLPDFDPQCCAACGYDCRELGIKLLKGEAEREACAAGKGAELYVGGKRINMVPFVQRVLKGTVLGLVKELDGYCDNAEIEIRFR